MAAMDDGLSLLGPDDPENLLSTEARKRILRALVDSDKYLWRARITIQQQSFNPEGLDARVLLSDAAYDKAHAVLSAYQSEFSQIGLSDSEFRKAMKSEIEAAANSLQLSDAQRRLLETEFFFPLDIPATNPPAAAAPALPPATAETVAAQIDRLRQECHLSAEELAEEVEMDARSVRRHLAGDTVPHPRGLRVYQKVFSKLLNRQVVISKVP